MPVWVRRVEGDEVVISANHPLSGQRLRFRIQVVDVNEAPAGDEQAPDT